jgi:hypothetical protein
MIIEEEGVRPELPPREGKGAGSRGAAAPSTDEVGRVRERLGKCPYLAGRPPCGTHHLFPSGVNVCWAEPSEGKPYRAISVDTQERHCFGGEEGRSDCPRYQEAMAAGQALPQFDRLPTPQTRRLAGVMPRSRRRRHPRSRLLFYASWGLPLGLMVLLLTLLLR